MYRWAPPPIHSFTMVAMYLLSAAQILRLYKQEIASPEVVLYHSKLRYRGGGGNSPPLPLYTALLWWQCTCLVQRKFCAYISKKLRSRRYFFTIVNSGIGGGDFSPPPLYTALLWWQCTFYHGVFSAYANFSAPVIVNHDYTTAI